LIAAHTARAQPKAFKNMRQAAPPAPAPDVASDLADLVARVALGNRAAFQALYQRTCSQLFGAVVRIQPDRAQAEDVLQEIYVNVWRAAASFDPTRAQPMAWLVSIARHAAIDSLRRAQARVQAAAPAAGPDGDEEDPVERVASDTPGPLDLLQQAADARELTRCVDHLSSQQQQCVALAFYQGLSHGEISQHLAQPIGTVKSWLRRALLTLKDCLARAAGQSVAAWPREQG